MDKMEGEWKDVVLDVAPYKDTGTFVLRSFDELQAILDEHITTTQAMMFSAFKGPFEERLGITARAQNLASGRTGAELETLIAAHRRLTHPDEMGNLFKVLGLYPPHTPPPPGLEP